MNDRTEQLTKLHANSPLYKARDSWSPGNSPQGNKNIDNLDHIPAVLYVIQTDNGISLRLCSETFLMLA